MHDSILQIKNSLQDLWQKFENDMQKIIQELKEKLSKWESQNSAPKVVVQKKSEHSYAAKPKEVHDDVGQIQVHHLKFMTKRLLIKKKARGQFFPGLYAFFPGPDELSPGARTKSPRTKARHKEHT